MTKRRRRKGSKLWGALKRAWKGYRIAKIQGDVRKLEYYAEGILKLRKALGLRGKAYPMPPSLPRYIDGVILKKSKKAGKKKDYWKPKKRKHRKRKR
jgi:hypothetical protein